MDYSYNHPIARVIIQGENNDLDYRVSNIITSTNTRGRGIGPSDISSGGSLNCSIESISVPIFNNLPTTTILFIDSLGVSHNIVLSSALMTTSLFGHTIVTALTAADTGGATYSFVINAGGSITFTSTSPNWSINLNDPYWEQRASLLGLRSTTTSSISSGVTEFSSQLIFVETNLSQGIILNNLTNPIIPSSRTCNDTTTFSMVFPTKVSVDQLNSVVVNNTLTPFVMQKYFGEYGTKFRVSDNIASIGIRLYDELHFPIITSPQRWYIVLIFT